MTTKFHLKQKYVAIGLMSGTSLDGLDMVCVEFILENNGWKYEILKSETQSFDAHILSDLKEVMGKNIKDETTKIDLKFGAWIADCVANFMASIDVEVDLIASHGQTIYHDPQNGITIQIGDGQVIADKCKVVVVNNFRSLDVEHGGQGAPLVPIGDIMLFNEYSYCLNLGGIANISEKINGDIKAFDVSICNIGANHFAQKLGFPYDQSGNMGAQGRIIKELFDGWNDLTFFSQNGPKSLDASFFNNSMLDFTLKFTKYNPHDFLRTLYEHIAHQISRIVVDKSLEILVSGGGAHNKFLINLMRKKYNLNITIPTSEIIEFKEALIFSLMGVLRIRNEVNVLSEVTGSGRDTSSGDVFRPN